MYFLKRDLMPQARESHNGINGPILEAETEIRGNFSFLRVHLNFDFFLFLFILIFVFDALLTGGGAQHTAMVGGQGQNRFWNIFPSFASFEFYIFLSQASSTPTRPHRPTDHGATNSFQGSQ